MKKFALKSVATVVGVGLSGVAAAQVDLDSKSPEAYKYASEATVSTKGVDLGGSLSAVVKTGVAFNKDSTGYLRFDLSAGSFTAEPALECATGTVIETTAVVGATNTFTVFALLDNSTGGIAATESCTLTVNGITVTSQDNVKIKSRLFETLTNALNPSDSNTLLPAKEATLISFAPALSVKISSASATATVAHAYKSFDGVAAASLGKVTSTVASGVRSLTGSDVTFSDIVASSTVAVAGDFSFVTDKNSVKIDGTAATSLTGTTKANFGSVVGSGDKTLAVTANTTTAIPAGTYTATVALTAQTGYTVTSPAAATIGTINRDGNQLLIPLAQSVSGYISRFTLVNRGSSDAAYTVSIIQEDGGTATVSGDAASGTVKANSTKVVELTSATITNFNGRGALLVTVEAASNTISGTYQITNRASGAVSNQTMVTVSNAL